MNEIEKREWCPVRQEWKTASPYSVEKEVTFMDCGYFYAPYVPLVSTSVVIDSESFNPNEGILTRYGKKLLDGAIKHYGIMLDPDSSPVYYVRNSYIVEDWMDVHVDEDILSEAGVYSKQFPRKVPIGKNKIDNLMDEWYDFVAE